MMLETYNKAERLMNQANTVEQLKQVGLWLRDHFQRNPEELEIREDLAQLYKKKLGRLKTKHTVETTKKANIYLKLWIAKKIETPRELRVEVVRETEKAYLVKGHAVATPTDTCRRCGRHLTHPVSVLYGIGPECGGHYHIPASEQDIDKIREMVEAIEYEGWLPKSGISNIEFVQES